MSTYAIADAIKNFSKDLKEVISEKNKIEKDKLAFEKEKFEFGKQRLDTNNERGNNQQNNSECKHEWHNVGSASGSKSRYDVFVCSKCGEQYTRKTVFNKKDGSCDIYILDDDT